jgi:hypothetical protein
MADLRFAGHDGAWPVEGSHTPVGCLSWTDRLDCVCVWLETEQAARDFILPSLADRSSGNGPGSGDGGTSACLESWTLETIDCVRQPGQNYQEHDILEGDKTKQ